MRLCGFSNCFQLLSPCIRQVTHALLTRPPLRYYNLWPKSPLTLSPFDLHVLGTPPAFILSQDQTLVFFPSSFSRPASLVLPSLLLLFLLTWFLFSESSFFLRIFRVALLFICQGSVGLFWRNSIILSQLLFPVKTFFTFFFQLFSSSFPLPALLPAVEFYYISSALFCQQKFSKIYILF